MGLLKMLFGGKNRYQIKCPNCNHVGSMYTKSGKLEGNFEIIGKTENASLHIKECPNCKKSLSYDPLLGKVKIFLST